MSHSPIFTIDSFPTPSGPLRYGIVRDELRSAEKPARPVVFVPGLGGSVKNALSFMRLMAQEFGVVYSLDARGFGINEGRKPTPNPSAYLKDFQKFILYLQQINAIDENNKPIIIGISLGSVLSTLFTTSYQHPFTAQILVAPAFRPHPQLFDTSFKLKNYSQVFIKGPWALTRLPYGIQDLTRNADLYNDPLFQDPLVLPTFYLFFVDLLCRKALSRCKRIAIPTAVVVPEKDSICDPVTMTQACKCINHPQTRLLNYPDLYHDVFMEPEEDQRHVVTDLVHWLSDLEPSQDVPHQARSTSSTHPYSSSSDRL